ncbi:hypothetical protein ASPZODRAFT_150179 [Penicilliopsis zonata CBS 506.65]|uniref:Uncharacterized protein n=1 Tax=Penicilliopsis zonata CBS 506.65 TaxID=1073090 RepID=A0A1L9SQA2_9EURO|nr:hypothetical protein ASPZODRAFT_150179 [Penicilliopsis zonata CBS 506.65]OJJ49263.1 hypothetical protein ASPZODRAFT_150179 [Penicilliopsis zonata CBS 506.65]
MIGNHSVKRDSWESLSSAFSHLEVSISQDSCYGSDDISVLSAIPPTSVTSGEIPSLDYRPGPPLRTALKSILKKPCTTVDDDSDFESGYGSELSDSEDDMEIVNEDDITDEEDDEEDEDEEEDDDDDDGDHDSYHDSVWDDDAPELTEAGRGSDLFDDSFICFESMVRFNTTIEYIDAVDPPDEDGGSDSQITLHEMMELAQTLNGSPGPLDEFAVSHFAADGAHAGHEAAYQAMLDSLSDHARDEIDLDRRLFAAYVNGINGIADYGQRAHLHAHVADLQRGRVKSPFLETDTTVGIYLDQVLNHVIGTFRHLVTRQEFDELLQLTGGCQAQAQAQGQAPASDWKEGSAGLAPKRSLLGKIEQLLRERLAGGLVEVGGDEMGFFAGGVAYALEDRHYTWSE